MTSPLRLRMMYTPGFPGRARRRTAKRSRLDLSVGFVAGIGASIVRTYVRRAVRQSQPREAGDRPVRRSRAIRSPFDQTLAGLQGGAGSGGRTHMSLRTADFKSAAFACFAIPAREPRKIS